MHITEEQDFSIVFQNTSQSPESVGSWTGCRFFAVNDAALRTAGGGCSCSCSSTNISVMLLIELNKSEESTPASSGCPGL
jgi:hypothetical protein